MRLSGDSGTVCRTTRCGERERDFGWIQEEDEELKLCMERNKFPWD